MRTVRNVIVIGTAFSVCLVTAICSAAASTPEDRVTFYEVPLACPAAKELGCGSAAKPVLLELERDPTIDEAWLNKAGTTLAIVWSQASTLAARATALAAIAGPHGVTVQELTGKARREALKSFDARERWYRGASVDRLSEEEAGVIADRLLRRLTISAPTASAKVACLKPVLTEVIRQQLVGTCTSPTACRDGLIAAAREHLTETEVQAFGNAIDLGFRPVGDER